MADAASSRPPKKKNETFARAGEPVTMPSARATASDVREDQERNPKSRYWQHREPLQCPKRHLMTWLGSAFWICSECHTIYVQQKAKT